MKYSTTLIVIFLLITLVSSFLVESKRIKQKQDQIHLVINLNVGNGKPRVTVHTQSNPEITQESQSIIQQTKQVISKKEEKKIATNFLEYAKNIENIYKSLPSNGKTKSLKQKLLKYMDTLSKRSAHPTSDILKGSLNDIVQESSIAKQENGGAKSLFIGNKLRNKIKLVSGKVKEFASKAQKTWKDKGGQKFIDGIGTYAQKVDNIGSKLNGDISQQLQRFGFPKLANMASKMGNSIQKFSKTKLGPLEEKLKNKVLPFVKKTSGKVKETVGLIKGTISQFKAFKDVKIPKNFKDVKKSITQIKKAAKNFNGKTVVNNIKKIRGNVKELAKSFKRKKK